RTLPAVPMYLFFYVSPPDRDLHSFPTRRSSDLQEREAARSVPDQSTGLNDQTELNVTVYNSNIALVRDVRNLVLPAGTFRLKFRSEEHTSELQSLAYLVCRLLLEKKNIQQLAET